MNRVIILGADGYIGWPLYNELIKHTEVIPVDNGFRRQIDCETRTSSATKIQSAEERFGKRVLHHVSIDERDGESFFKKFLKTKDDLTIVHLAEIRSAPYSMLSYKHAKKTIDNNINGTSNLLNAVARYKPDAHIVHIGTMGVYGYDFESNHKIGEGYHKDGTPYKYNPGSVYHMTKCMDNVMFMYYNKNFGLKITDLHQGIVWGVDTKITREEKKPNRFDVCSNFGTVLNRLVSQAAYGIPMTVYGTGMQKRAFINIEDSIKCLKLAIENEPKDTSRVRVFNQVSESLRVIDIANRIKNLVPNSEISKIENPRSEKSGNELDVDNSSLLNLGWTPKFLDDNSLIELLEMAIMSGRKPSKHEVSPTAKWRW